jgi:hypothetical protein
MLMLIRAILSVLSMMCPIDASVANAGTWTAHADAAQRALCCDEKLQPVSSRRVGGGATSTPEAGPTALAKTLLRKQLRRPDSAQFTMVAVRTASDGSTAVCGMIDSRNDTDGMTGPKPFVYDGKDVYVLIASDGADNGTIHDGRSLDQAFKRAEETHSKFCR